MFSGEVTYTVSGWMEKNNGRMVPEMESLILGSSNAWARELGDQEVCREGVRGRSKSRICIALIFVLRGAFVVSGVLDAV